MSNWYRQLSADTRTFKHKAKDFFKGVGYGVGLGVAGLGGSQQSLSPSSRLKRPPSQHQTPALVEKAVNQPPSTSLPVSTTKEMRPLPHVQQPLSPKPAPHVKQPSPHAKQTPNVRAEEGSRPKVYEDPLVLKQRAKDGLPTVTDPLSYKTPTIGIGHHIQHNNRQPDANLLKAVGGDVQRYNSVRSGKAELSPKEIETLYQLDVTEHSHLAQSMVKRRYNLDLTQLPSPVKEVVNAMFFQIGPKAINFHNFFNYLKAGNYAKAADALLGSHWAKQTPARVKRMSDIIRSNHVQ